MDIKLEGLEMLISNIEDIADTSKLVATMKKACTAVERSAKLKAYAPKGNGDLQRSITSYVEADGKEVVGTVFTPLEYAPYVEYGTGMFAEDGKGRKDVPWFIHIGYGENDITPEVVERYNFRTIHGKNGEDFAYTYGSHPHPFLRPALYENKETITQIIRGGLDV